MEFEYNNTFFENGKYYTKVPSVFRNNVYENLDKAGIEYETFGLDDEIEELCAKHDMSDYAYYWGRPFRSYFTMFFVTDVPIEEIVVNSRFRNR